MCRFILGCYAVAAAIGTDAPESIGEFVKKALFFAAGFIRIMVNIRTHL